MARYRYHLITMSKSSPRPPEGPVALGVCDEAGEPEEEPELPPLPPLQDLQVMWRNFELRIWKLSTSSIE